MGADAFDIKIQRGRTFEWAFRRAEPEFAYSNIVSITSMAPLRISAPNHGIPQDWMVAIENVARPEELNTADGDFYYATVISPDVIELNNIDTTGWRAYSSGGVFKFNKPFDLTGCSARMQIRRTIDAPVLLYLSSNTNELRDGEIEIDVVNASLIAKLSAVATAAITWKRAVYDIELTTPDGAVYAVTPISHVYVADEVTR